MTDFLKEELQEALVELQKSRLRERRFAEENDAILTAISALSDAQTKQQMFNALLVALKKYIHFDDALVLSKAEEQPNFCSFLSTNPAFDDTCWSHNSKFARALAGECLVMYDPAKISFFETLNHMGSGEIQSALICGVSSEISQSVIILAGKEKGQFNSDSKHTLSRLMPLVRRAMQEIDQKEKLQLMVDLRTRELENNRQRFIDFAQSTGDWLWETDHLLNISYHTTSTNSAILQIKKNLLISLNSLSKGSEAKRISAAIAKFEPFVDIELETGDGQFISISGKPYFTDKMNYLGYRGTAKDITSKRKQILALKQAQQQALQASQAKSEFLAVMSHEIRTPLNTIFGFMDILRDQMQDEQIDILKKVESSASLLGVLISDILDLSKIESGHFVLDPQTTNLPELIRDSVTHHIATAQSKGIDLHVDITPDVPEHIDVDSTRLTQILFNLVGNAVKFTTEGEVRLTAACTDDNQLLIKVKDTGIGIPEDSIDSLFNAFQQADSSITRTFGGTGLGLAITRQLVSLMGGEIKVNSVIGQGSCFIVQMPITKILSGQKSEAISVDHPAPKSRKILLVEDNKTNQMLIEMLLKKLGHHVELASNGLESVDILTRKKQQFDLIFMDLSMPVMGGLEATSIIRSKAIQTPIIALTAHAMESDKESCLNAGMNGFVTKPIRSADLRQALKEVFGDE
ncbi:ATP-binding protein [Vibrio sp. JC009]|uniref:ATP-binding protein n=1 Tax=Vibrio sp. JC009 TaxID=2912314 RepID=UPI0023AFA9D7|nr:ATP-binding protein [Vibrio sp. JC009]WED23184.1 ATP-binding protein [Vibrio sp. JC009]